MAISVTDLDPLHYITAERVASLRKLTDFANEEIDVDDRPFWRKEELWAFERDVRVLLMALEQLTGSGK